MSGWHNFAVWFAQMFCLRFSFVHVIVLVSSVLTAVNFYFYIVFVSQIHNSRFCTHRTKCTKSSFHYKNSSVGQERDQLPVFVKE